MKTNMAFPSPDFLLQSPASKRLYSEYAANMPIMDYHNHLLPSEVAGNRRFTNLTEIWLAGDHYKWRAMRTAGIGEKYITGNASDREKFNAWASVVPQTLCNPIYHWTHMELQNPLGIKDRLLNPQTAASIWEEGNAQLAQPGCSVRGLLKNWNVELICTTDDPVDDLHHHDTYAHEHTDCRMIPAFRPDRLLAFGTPTEWNAWVDKLSASADVDIHNLDSLLSALEKRCDFFHDRGGRLSDHGIEAIPFAYCTDHEAAAHIQTLRGGNKLDVSVIPGLITYLLLQLGRMYHKRGWTQQFHVGALRNANTRQANTLGRDTGFDMIGDLPQAQGLTLLFDLLEQDQSLTKTIVYNLNPADNEVMASMIGCFQDGITPGKIQYGSGWWFLDQKDGIEKQLTTLANLGLLSRFIGMLTDSRSFLSFSRHDYFRRILCNFLGDGITQGLLPSDFDLVGGMVKDICYRNADRYFEFPKGDIP